MFGLSVKEKLVEAYKMADKLDEAGLLESSQKRLSKMSDNIADMSEKIAKVQGDLRETRGKIKSAKEKLKEMKADKKEYLRGENFRENHPFWGKWFLPTSIPTFLLSAIVPPLGGLVKGALSHISDKDYRNMKKEIKAQANYVKTLEENQAKKLAKVAGLEDKLNSEELKRNSLIKTIKEIYTNRKSATEALITLNESKKNLKDARSQGIISEEFYEFVQEAKKAMKEEKKLPYGISAKEFGKIIKDYNKKIEISLLKGSTEKLEEPTILTKAKKRAENKARKARESAENNEEAIEDNDVTAENTDNRRRAFDGIDASYYTNLGINGNALSQIISSNRSCDDYFEMIGFIAQKEYNMDMANMTEVEIRSIINKANREYKDFLAQNRDTDEIKQQIQTYRETGAKIFKNCITAKDNGIEDSKNAAQYFLYKSGAIEKYNQALLRIQNNELANTPELNVDSNEQDAVNI